MIVKERAIVFSEPPTSQEQQIWLEIEGNRVIVKGHPRTYDYVLSKPDVRQLIDALSNYMVSGQFTVSRPLKKFIRW